MIPILYPDTETSFANLGYGHLTDAITCVVKEVRNGEYSLQMTYPMSGRHFKNLQLRNIVLALPNYEDDVQAFRIYKITRPLNGIVTVYANHISYDLNGYLMPNGLSASTAAAAVTLINGYANNFTLSTNISKTRTFKTDIPRSVRYWLAENKGSLQKRYKGVWKWNNFTGQLLSSRGSNKGAKITYGVNMTKLQVEDLCDNVYTGLYGYYKKSDGTIITCSEVLETGADLSTDRILILDTSRDFGSDVPSVNNIDVWLQEYLNDNTDELTNVYAAVTVDYCQLATGPVIYLSDIARVRFDDLGVSVNMRCTETNFNVLLERYDSVKFGDKKKTITNTIRQMGGMI